MADPTPDPREDQRAEIAELRESNERLAASVDRLSAAVEVVNDLRVDQASLKEDQHHLRETVQEQGELMQHATVPRDEYDDTKGQLIRRGIITALSLLILTLALAWGGYEFQQHRLGQRAQVSRSGCEKRNQQSAVLDAYLRGNVDFVRRMIAAEELNTFVSSAIREQRIAAYRTALSGDLRALDAFVAVHLDCARLYPGTHR